MKFVYSLIIRLFNQAFGSQLRRNMTAGMIGMGVNAVALFVSYPLYLYFIDYEKYGLWLILSMVLGFSRMGLLGIKSAVIKLVSEEYGIADTRGIQSYMVMGLTIVLCMGLTALTVILIFKTQIVHAFKLTGENAELVAWLLPYIGLLSIYALVVQILNSVLSGLARMDLGSYIDAAGRVVAIGTSVLLLSLDFGVKGLLIGELLSYVAVHGASLFFIHRIIPVRIFRASNWDNSKFKRLLSFGGGIFGVSLLGLLLDPFNKLMLSRHVGVAAIPVYDISFRGAMQLRTLIETGIRAVMPQVSQIGAKMADGAKAVVFAMNKRLIKLIVLYVLPVYAGIFIFAEILLKVWLQEKYIDTLPLYFRIMLVASFVSLLGLPSYYILMGQGRIRYCIGSHVVLGVVNVTIVLFYALTAPSLVESRVYYALLLGYSMGALYVIWRFWRYNKADAGNASALRK